MQLAYYQDEHTPPVLASRTYRDNGDLVCYASDETLRSRGAKEWDNGYPEVAEGYYVEPIGYLDGDIIQTVWSDPIPFESEVEV